jgi:dihydropteroate synthase
VTGRGPTERDPETHAASVLGLAAGARIFRVHDLGGARRALDFARAVLEASAGEFAPGEGSWPWRAGADAPHASEGRPLRPPPAGQRW